MTRRPVVTVAAVLLAAVVAAARQPPSPRAGEPAAAGLERAAPAYERPVKTVATGPQKLRVDVPLLVGGQPFERVGSAGGVTQAHGGLADLRLADGAGQEIAYLLIAPSRRQASWIPGRILQVAGTQKTSGFEVDLGEPRDIDTLAIDGLPAPFLKRFTLEGSGDRARWTLLVSQGTIFDLPDERVRLTQVEFATGSYRYLRVAWDDTNSGRLPLPRDVRAREDTLPSRTEPLRAAVTAEPQTSEPGRSRYRIQLPAAGLPIVALTLAVGAGDVFRTATIMETRFSGARADPVELGRSRLVRTGQQRGADPMLRIGMQPPRSAELQLVVEDGNNPPLTFTSVEIEFAELPWIFFEAPAGPVTARYGSRTAKAPQYDLEARRAAIDLTGVREAAWGEPRAATPVSGSAAAPSPVPDRGASVNVPDYRYRRALPTGPEGLVALQLDAAVLSHSQGAAANFADLRVVDEQSRQIPYLIERRAEPLSLTLTPKPAVPQVRALSENRDGNRSFYAIALPYANLPDPRLVLETSDRVFRRSLQVGVERQPDRRRREAWFDALAAPAWQHADQRTAAPPLEVSISPGDATELLLIVEEGDNRPLAISSARVLLPSWRLRFFRPAQPLRLLYGKDDASVPEYDLALLAPAVMGGEARDIAAESEEAAASSPPASVLSLRVFWIGLGLAVVVLLGLIVRLISSGTEPLPPSPPGP